MSHLTGLVGMPGTLSSLLNCDGDCGGEEPTTWTTSFPLSPLG